MTQVLTVAASKGGVGKTTTTLNLGYLLARRGVRVSLLDLDPQSSLTLAFGEAPSASPWEERSRLLELEGLEPGALELIPAGRALALGTVERVRRLIERASEGRDLLVVDTPPGLTPLSVAALELASLVLVPLEASPLALPGLADVAAVVEGLTPPPALRVVLSRVHPRRILTDDVRTQLAASYAGALYDVAIPEDVRCAEAPGFGLPVTLYARRATSAAAYERLARAVAKDLHLSPVRR